MQTDTHSVFCFVILACIGGTIVLVGLLMEFLAEKPRFANISAFRFWERIKRWGELIVIIGIVVEIIVGGMFARDEWENSPWNGKMNQCTTIFPVDGGKLTEKGPPYGPDNHDCTKAEKH